MRVVVMPTKKRPSKRGSRASRAREQASGLSAEGREGAAVMVPKLGVGQASALAGFGPATAARGAAPDDRLGYRSAAGGVERDGGKYDQCPNRGVRRHAICLPPSRLRILPRAAHYPITGAPG